MTGELGMSETLIHNFKFDAQGLLPAVVQDAATGEVLTLAYMNAESLARTLQTGETWFWSRSRGELWHKGATSGHTQRVVDVRLDCDGDALLVRVEPRGPACHTGERTCFFRGADGGAEVNEAAEAKTNNGGAQEKFSASATVVQVEQKVSLVGVPAMELGILLQDLFVLIQERREQRPANSYTTYLFDSGLDKILKKVGEEAAETIIAAKNEGTKELTSEITDLLYHLLVLMAEREVSLRDILSELGKRAGRPAEAKYSK
jgi:phosphoribosyl-AMP cyclohydrolase / phosphoribosyl-ATP pyrophosphohydrolase